jgi:hypothetical protein
MGHAQLATTERYLHFKERGDEADLLAGAFAASGNLLPEFLPNNGDSPVPKENNGAHPVPEGAAGP